MSIKDDFDVVGIPTKLAKPWILNRHYAGRMPSVSFAFGLYDKNDNIVGVYFWSYANTPRGTKVETFPTLRIKPINYRR